MEPLCGHSALFPDLVIHPRLHALVRDDPSRSLDVVARRFNVVPYADLWTRYAREASVALIGRDDARRAGATLVSRYDQRIASGSDPTATSYFFHRDTPMYRVARGQFPRYVIWTVDDPLDVCATYVDRVDHYDVYGALERAAQWSGPMLADPSLADSSIVVFDLDRTLIGDEREKLVGADDALATARRYFDKLVLWSHGSSLHVDEACLRFPRDAFDLKLSNRRVKNYGSSPKNLLSLYNYFPRHRFTRAVLVDDSIFNWTPEYTDMYVPMGDPPRDVSRVCEMFRRDFNDA